MGLSKQLRDTSNELITGCFENVSTEADVTYYSAKDAGKRQIIKLTAALLADPNGIELPWHYQVGNNHLQIYTLNTTTGALTKILNKATLDAADQGAGTPYSAVVPYPATYYQEITTNRVLFTGISANTYVLFETPHTSTPGQFTRKVVVEDQSDHIGMELLGNGNGVAMRNTDGTRWLMRIGPTGPTFEELT